MVLGAGPAAAQNGVGASTRVMINTVGSSADIGAGQRLGKTVPQPQIVVATGVAAESESYVYRGVSRAHPGYDDAVQGNAIPRNVNGSTTAEAHNYGNAGDLADSPFTSWTRDPSVARSFAGDDGVVLRLPTGQPPAGSTWKFEWSPDVWFEQEVLVRGPVYGAGRVG
jgi:hypothetical protein